MIVVDQNTIFDVGKETLMIPLKVLAVIFVVYRNAELVTMAKMEQNRIIIRMFTAFRFRINQEERQRQFLPLRELSHLQVSLIDYHKVKFCF